MSGKSRHKPPRSKRRKGQQAEDSYMPDNDSSEFTSAGEALKKLGQDFNDWCSIFTTHSIQAAYAIIAANWAVHRTTDAILNNSFADINSQTNDPSLVNILKLY